MPRRKVAVAHRAVVVARCGTLCAEVMMNHSGHRGPWRAVVVVVVGLALSVGACTKKSSDEEQIRAALHEGAAALNASDSARAAEILSEAYVDANGRKRDQMKKLAFQLLRRERLLVSLADVSTTIDGDDAAAVVTALVLASPPEVMTIADLVPENAKSLHLDIRLKRAEGSWKVTAIDGDGDSMGAATF